MKVYLEFKDEKSEKFWEVSVDGNTHTVRYGKIGAKGTSKTKEFDSGESAVDDATKLANSKKKKGYVEVSPFNCEDNIFPTMIGPRPQVMSYDEWKESGRKFFTDDIYDVVYFDGDLHVKEDFSPEWCSALLEELDIDEGLIHIDGNLTVDGYISPSFDHTMINLLVSGDVKCDELTSGDEIIEINGDAHIKYFLVGDYNDGHIGIYGTTYVPYLLNKDHSTYVTLAENSLALCISTRENGDGMMDYHFIESEFSEVMKPEVYIDGYFDYYRKVKPFIDRGESIIKDAALIEKGLLKK